MEKQVPASGAIKKMIVPLLFVLLIGAVLASAYFYRELQVLKTDPNKVAQAEVADLLTAVGELMVLPEGETPTVATVSDPEQLKDQAFFAKAKAGDRVLLYTTAKKAILYDPIANKIVEVAPINIGQAAPGAEVAGAETENPTTPPTTP